MGEHPVVARQIVQAIESDGAGAGGTRNISGTNAPEEPVATRSGLDRRTA